MVNTTNVAKALELEAWLNNELYGLAIPGSIRGRVSAACFAVTQDHHHAIALLLQADLNSSAFALVRSQYESFIRGTWIANCATEQQVDRFCKSGKLPEIAELISAIEKIPSFNSNFFSELKKQSWCAMCDYAHTGALSVQGWNTTSAIEPNFNPAAVAEVHYLSNALVIFSAFGMATLSNNIELEKKLLAKALDYAK